MTEKQREAINAMLALHKEGSITVDTAMTVIEAVFESGASLQYIPYTMPCEPYKSTPNPFNPFPTTIYSSSGTTDEGSEKTRIYEQYRQLKQEGSIGACSRTTSSIDE